MSKQKIREWLMDNASGDFYPDNRISMGQCVAIIHQYTQEQSGWVGVDSIELVEGDQWLCMYKGERIVLELGHETPTYEENFKPYFYWVEPYSDMIVIEWDDISCVQPLPPTEEA